MKSSAKITVLATDNPNRFEVKIKTDRSLKTYSVKARDSKQAVERYPDESFSSCIMSLFYSH